MEKQNIAQYNVTTERRLTLRSAKNDVHADKAKANVKRARTSGSKSENVVTERRLTLRSAKNDVHADKAKANVKRARTSGSTSENIVTERRLTLRSAKNDVHADKAKANVKRARTSGSTSENVVTERRLTLRSAKDNAGADKAKAVNGIETEEASDMRFFGPPQGLDAGICSPHILTTPSVAVKTKADALDPKLKAFCFKHPISVVRGLPAALKLNLDIFSTKALLKVNNKKAITLLIINTSFSNWKLNFRYRKGTIASYSRYQERFAQQEQKGQNIQFATNINFEKKIYALHWKELEKLPDFTKVESENNMLSHIGYEIEGMNTIQLYMKVPESKTSGHQENNNFCSVNISIGSGDCEWFAVANEYWPKVQELCKKNGVNYFKDMWWPVLKDLADANIPVYRFIQRPGDLVFVNLGCVHWVKAIGITNNIAWNVGPMIAEQYVISLERYELNKLHKLISIVAMEHLTWNLARKIKEINIDKNFCQLIKNYLLQSLNHVKENTKYLKSKGVKVLFDKRDETIPSFYCLRCRVELFTIIFKQKRNAYCIKCAKPSFECFIQYHTSQIQQVFEEFQDYMLEKYSNIRQ